MISSFSLSYFVKQSLASSMVLQGVLSKVDKDFFILEFL